MNTVQYSFEQLLENLQQLDIPEELKKRLRKDICSLLCIFIGKAMSDQALAKMKSLRNFGAVNRYAPVLSHEDERKPDFDEAVVLANTLIYLKNKYGIQPDVRNFMAYLKVLLERQQLGSKTERCETLIKFGDANIRKNVTIQFFHMAINAQNLKNEIPVAKVKEYPLSLLNNSIRAEYVKLQLPGYEPLKWSFGRNLSQNESLCDPNVLHDELGAFVIKHIGNTTPIGMDDFYFLLQNRRYDFLLYVIQNKLLPVSNDELRVLCAVRSNLIEMDAQLEILKTLDNDIEPGGNAKFRDAFGNDLIWYTLSSNTIPTQEATGQWTGTTIVQDYLFKIIGTAHKQFHGYSLEEILQS